MGSSEADQPPLLPETVDGRAGIVGARDVDFPFAGKFGGEEGNHRFSGRGFQHDVGGQFRWRERSGEIDEEVMENLPRYGAGAAEETPSRQRCFGRDTGYEMTRPAPEDEGSVTQSPCLLYGAIEQCATDPLVAIRSCDDEERDEADAGRKPWERREAHEQRTSRFTVVPCDPAGQNRSADRAGACCQELRGERIP
ncbi:hypothetical protein HRbin27_01454 [bacterium HR27]|nr:hypothetical protein HRbin27_01454 [bacterium HR27]